MTTAAEMCKAMLNGSADNGGRRSTRVVQHVTISPYNVRRTRHQPVNNYILRVHQAGGGHHAPCACKPTLALNMYVYPGEDPEASARVR